MERLRQADSNRVLAAPTNPKRKRAYLRYVRDVRSVREDHIGRKGELVVAVARVERLPPRDP